MTTKNFIQLNACSHSGVQFPIPIRSLFPIFSTRSALFGRSSFCLSSSFLLSILLANCAMVNFCQLIFFSEIKFNLSSMRIICTHTICGGDCFEKFRFGSKSLQTCNLIIYLLPRIFLRFSLIFKSRKMLEWLILHVNRITHVRAITLRVELVIIAR